MSIDFAPLLPPPWVEHAACAGSDPELFYPERTTPRRAVAAIRRVCAGCPVRQQCLDDAIGRGDRYGIWGGLTYHERLAYARTGATPAPPPTDGTRLCRNAASHGPASPGYSQCYECRDASAKRDRARRARNRAAGVCQVSPSHGPVAHPGGAWCAACLEVKAAHAQARHAARKLERQAVAVPAIASRAELSPDS